MFQSIKNTINNFPFYISSFLLLLFFSLVLFAIGDVIFTPLPQNVDHHV